MKAKKFILLTTLIITLAIASPVYASPVFVNNVRLDINTYMEKDTTLVPLRSIFQSLGAVVNWNSSSQTVTAYKNGTTVILPLGSNLASVNNTTISLQVPGKIIQGSTMVPLRFVSESLGASVKWDQNTHIIYINTDNNDDNNNPSEPDYLNTTEVTKIASLEELYNQLGSFYTNTVNTSRNVKTNQDLYDVIQTGLQNTQEKINFKVNVNTVDFDNQSMLALIDKILDDHPDLNYVDSYSISSNRLGNCLVEFKYNYPVSQVKEMKAAVDAKAFSIVSQLISPQMTSLEREKVIHDYIVLHTKYDEVNYKNNTLPATSYTAYGVLINGTAVCQGYAAAMYKLLNMSGVECKFVRGTATNSEDSGPHAWNMVKIDGTWYYIDTTWDDPVPDRAGIVSHDYFNLTASEMSAHGHSWD